MNRFLNPQLLPKLYKHIVGVYGLNNKDVILTSFPKSGNTWVRFFFCNLISLTEWEGKPIDFQILDNTMVEFGVSNLLNPWQYTLIPRLVKTHKSYLPFFANKKVILITRDPRDVMVSYYYFSSNKKTINFSGTFSDLIRHPKLGLESWFRYHQSWQSVRTEIFYYEAIKNDEYNQFLRMLNFLQIDLPDSIIYKAIQSSQFEKVKQREEKIKHYKEKENKEEFIFARKGIVGDWKNFFSESDLSYYNSLIKKYTLENFNYY
jgi:estrone sulfotransferase